MWAEMLANLIKKGIKNIITMKNTQNTQTEMKEKLSAISYEDDLTVDPETRLTPHFKLKEFIVSGTAIKHNLDNNPSIEEVGRLQALAENVLEPLRRNFGAIRITSGYRSSKVNYLVGGSRTSQHLYGEAVDIFCGSTEKGRKYYQYILEHCEFDQMLLEFKGGRFPKLHCLHVSYRSDRGTNRKRCLSHYPVTK